MAIVREHNGDISAQPLSTGGTVFTVALPVCTESQVIANLAPPAAPAQEESRTSPSLPLTGKRILVVDDEESILELVADSLGTRACLVDRTTSFERAMEMAGRGSYDAILSDLNLATEEGLPVSGFDLHDHIYETIKARSGKQPVFIFMTGELVESAISEKADREGNRFLQKPFRIAELHALLVEALSPTPVLLPGNKSR
jgi:CheY-like chemotaxis protein